MYRQQKLSYDVKTIGVLGETQIVAQFVMEWLISANSRMFVMDFFSRLIRTLDKLVSQGQQSLLKHHGMII